MKAYFRIIASGAFFFLQLVIGCYNLSYAEDKIIAIINKDIITQKDLNDFINFMRVQLSSEYKGHQLEDKIQSMKLDLIDRLIEDRLILQEAKKSGIIVDEARVRAKIDEIKRRYASEFDFQSTLKKQGLIQADLETKIREQALMFNIIDYKIKSKITIKPSEVTDFYNTQIQEFKHPEEREFESVSSNSESTMKEFYAGLKNRKDFAELAKKYDLYVNKLNATKSGELKKDIENIVFKLEKGGFSEPVKIDDNYYIFQLNDIIPPQQLNLNQAQDQIYTHLYNKKMEEELGKWLDELKKHAYIKIFP